MRGESSGHHDSAKRDFTAADKRVRDDEIWGRGARQGIAGETFWAVRTKPRHNHRS